MKILKFINFLLVVMLLVSCKKESKLTYKITEQNGIKIFKNSSQPANPRLTMKTKKLFTIKAQDGLARIENSVSTNFDKDDNLYTLSMVSSKMYKFDKNGKFIKSFCQRGHGPGEVENAAWFTILNDTILVIDSYGKKIVRFNLDGKFIDNKEVNDTSNLQFLKVAQNYIFAFNMIVDTQTQNIVYGIYRYTNCFKNIKKLETSKISLQEISQKKGFDLMSLISLFTCFKDKIYLATNSKDKFEIKVLDLNGNTKAKIRKPYRKVSFSKKELAEINKQFSKMNENSDLTMKIKADYKTSILALFKDSKNRLWVETARATKNQENGRGQIIYFDIFENNIYQNTVELKLPKSTQPLDIQHQLAIHKDRIYYFNFENEEIEVYQYEM